jgi:hypothetical protein
MDRIENAIRNGFFFAAGTSLRIGYLATIGRSRDRSTDTRVQQFFYCFVYSLQREAFTEPLPSRERRKYFTEPLPSYDWRDTNIDTYTEGREL